MVSSITDRNRVDDAQEAVTAAGLDLRSIVAVGTSGDLDSPTEAGVWAAPVHRGLYDEVWAADERVRIEHRLGLAAQTRERLEGQTSRDRALQERLRQLLDQCPAGHLDALAATAADLRTRLQAATTRRSEIAAEAAALGKEGATLQDIVESLVERVRTATDNAGRCEEQVRRDRQAAGWRADAADWRTQAQVLDVTAGEETTAADAARAVGDGARAEAAQRRRIIDTHGEERGTLPVVAPVTAPSTAVPTAVLRRVFQAATNRLENESAGKALAADLSVAEAREADAVKRLKLEPPAVTARARGLLVDPAAGDGGARREAQRRTAAEADHLNGIATDVAGNVKVAESELENRTPHGRLRWIDLPHRARTERPPPRCRPRQAGE